MPKKHLICIVGPTAVGKTAVGITLASAFETEIVSADSRQFYKELEIGTAKPSLNELSEAPHHFINSLSIHDAYDVGKYEQEAMAKLEVLFQNNDAVILVGGSGLFVNAVCVGLDDLPDVKPNVRAELNAELKMGGLDRLNEELKSADPEYYEIVDLKNPQRVIRALEVIRSTGKKFSEFRKRQPANRPFNVITIGLELDREVLYNRIDQRMDGMIVEGLFEEAKRLYEHKDLNPLQTVGYSEIFAYLDGRYDKEESIRLLKRNSRRYAKRQLTWFKRNPETVWFDPQKIQDMLTYLKKKLELPEAEN